MALEDTWPSKHPSINQFFVTVFWKLPHTLDTISSTSMDRQLQVANRISFISPYSNWFSHFYLDFALRRRGNYLLFTSFYSPLLSSLCILSSSCFPFSPIYQSRGVGKKHNLLVACAFFQFSISTCVSFLSLMRTGYHSASSITAVSNVSIHTHTPLVH